MTVNDRVNFRDLWHDSRAQVYLLWAALTGIGYVATQYYQNKNINIVWFVLSVIGLGYMYKVMPLGVGQMRRIFLSWLVPIGVGIGASILSVRTSLLPDLVAYLGAFWLALQAVAFVWNGLVDRPATWYFIAAGMNVVAAVLCYTIDAFTTSQYFIAAIVTIWSMLNLWIFRSDA